MAIGLTEIEMEERHRIGLPQWLLFGAVAILAVALAACGGSSGGALTPAADGDANANATANPAASANANADRAPAPEFPAGHTWFNVREPLTIAGLEGKVVLLDFWTSGCINCQQIVPDLTRLEDEFADELVVIGVHSGKYDREQEDQSVRESLLRYGLTHAVVNDPDFVIWSAYGVNAWPTLMLIDPEGNVVGGRSGEGVYAAFQPEIAAVIDEFDERGLIDRSPIAIDLEADGVSTSLLAYPSTVLADEAGGRLFIADAGHNRILISDLDGELQDAIGSGREGLEDGSFAEATLREPQGLALSEDGATLYIADTRNHAIRAADLESREVRTIAGSGERTYDFPAAGAVARETALASPWGLLVYEETLYVAMAGTHQIWTIDLADETISVFVGSGREGIDDGPPEEATLAQPSGLTSDGRMLYWVGPEASAVRRVALDGSGEVETLVGTGLFDFGDADGTGTEALLEHPQGLVYANDTLYVSDTYNHKLRTVDPTSREVRVVAGGPAAGFEDGSGTQSLLSEPNGLSVARGIIYVADESNHVIRLFDLATNVLSTLELSNLSVATQGVEGRTLTVSLEGQTISPEASSLRIRVAAPDRYYLNSLAPSELMLTSSNEPVLAVGRDSVDWSTDDKFVEISVPISVEEGDAVLTAQGTVYYCRSGEEAICLVEDIEIALPITVVSGASQAEAVVDYTLPGQRD